MKPTAACLVLCVALLSHCTAAFFMSSGIKPEIPAVPVLTPALEAGAGALEAGAGALEAGAGALAGKLPVPSLNSFSPLVLLKLLLTSLGIPVHHLVEGSRKCVTELGPEAVGALQSLLELGGLKGNRADQPYLNDVVLQKAQGGQGALTFLG